MPEEIDVDTRVENEVVSETLDQGESLTVPSNEVWAVSIFVGNDEDDGWAGHTSWTINDVQLTWRGDDTNYDRGPAHIDPWVLVGGDEIQVGPGPQSGSSDRAGAALITGFVIDSDYNND